MRYLHTALLGCALIALSVSAQEDLGKKIVLKGSVQSDVLFPQEDSKIDAHRDNWSLTNTYAEMHLMSKYFSAGARFEGLEHPLPGFEPGFKGRGVPYFYFAGQYKGLELTAGDFYDQFGSGLIFRTYEERSLGIDNSLRGGRLLVKSFNGVNLKLLGGKQRRYWHHNDSWVYGGDLEMSLDSWFRRMEESGTRLTLGFSAVSKHEDDTDILKLQSTGQQDEFGTDILGAYKLNLPKNIAAFDVRANFQKGGYNLLAEYAWKGQDPSFDNNYIYRKGNALLLSGSYSRRGMSLLLQAKRSENMSYRSDRTADGISSCINHLPAFSMQHTYALAALYPYATQNVLGEWAYQAELGYNFKRRTLLGGKYGTNVKVNFSHIRSIDRTPVTDASGAGVSDVRGTEGYTSKFFKVGDEIYYQDINVQVEKKLSRRFKLNLMYMNQRYNQTIVEGHGGTVKANIAVAEGKYNLSKKLTLRGEAQYLHTDQDQKDWWYGLLELSVLPSLMFTVSDMYNAHVPDASVSGKTNKVHYYMAAACFTHKAHRLQVSYGKTRAGYNCSGGVCRLVPASKGIQLSYNFNF
ncbi:MAG TPA: DUF6029 family protein [Alloprevotella sp.]|nr:DUF6029 family protein [Alloprevotella sp.]